MHRDEISTYRDGRRKYGDETVLALYSGDTDETTIDRRDRFHHRPLVDEELIIVVNSQDSATAERKESQPLLALFDGTDIRGVADGRDRGEELARRAVAKTE